MSIAGSDAEEPLLSARLRAKPMMLSALPLAEIPAPALEREMLSVNRSLRPDPVMLI
jgi:hypothetical protein